MVCTFFKYLLLLLKAISLVPSFCIGTIHFTKASQAYAQFHNLSKCVRNFVVFTEPHQRYLIKEFIVDFNTFLALNSYMQLCNS